MNFFEAQDSARRSTSLLVVLFLLAIAMLVVLSNLIVFQFLYFQQYATLTLSLTQLELVFDSNFSMLLSTAIIGFICLGSVYKLVQLSSGGAVIAQYLGGVIVPRSSPDPLHKKILNVVEEIAIASGTPVPQVYILNEPGINAFAAGWKTTNVVIGITQGALERLTRDELQGVIAHEFSHIFNGDMRLNIRLIAVLHGILMIGLLGRMMLRSMRFVRSSRNSKSGQAALLIFGIGAALTVVGYSGTFFGNWIKSLISRQREYLADASAVQYTRSSEGIGNALKKIGGAVPGSALLAASVDEYSHAYFALGNPGSSLFSFSTHPPLKQRILRIDPRWDGQYLFDERKPVKQATESHKKDKARQREKLANSIAAGVGINLALNEAMNGLENIGDVTQHQMEAAQSWHKQLPDEVLINAENPHGAQALMLALLLHAAPEIENKQYEALNEILGETHTGDVRRLQKVVADLARTQALPLIDLSLPTLKEMTLEQYQRFKLAVQQLISADRKVELREWAIQRVVLQHLDEYFGLRKKSIAKYFILGSAKYSSELMLTMLSHVEHSDVAEARDAFDGAKRSIAAGALKMVDKKDLSLVALDAAMDDLALLKPPIKKRFLQACVNCISHDGKVTIEAYELCRAIASCLNSPMPPVLINRIDESSH